VRQKSYDNSSSLYLIPTPIGNLDDITIRAINLLKFVDFILCEDTRESSMLLKKYEIDKKLVSCHEYNEEKIKDYILKELSLGKNIALITDQGTPIISDPGFVVARYVIENGYNVVGLPGATAFVPALIASGLSSIHFLYYGFLSAKESKLKKELNTLKNYPFTMIFYEAPHRIEKTLKNMLDVFGDRNISLSREISKVHEEVIRGKISECLSEINIIKGEFVILVEGNNISKKDLELSNLKNLSLEEHYSRYENQGLDKKEIIKRIAKDRNVNKNEIYQYFIKK